MNDAIVKKDGTIKISDPSQLYQKLVRDVSAIQVYKAGIRIANMLNAIYDPENASSAYCNFIEKITGKTLNKFCPVNIQFTNKI